MLLAGDAVPHFEVTTVDGTLVRYQTIWQRRNLVLVTLGRTTAEGGYAAAIASAATEFSSRAAECVATHDGIAGLPAPGVLVADRWGEIMYAVTGSAIDQLPSPHDLIEWLDYVEQRCPECEGEAR